jgi:hypothetical protein
MLDGSRFSESGSETLGKGTYSRRQCSAWIRRYPHLCRQGRTQGGCTGCTCIPPPPPVHPPPRPCASPPLPSPERLVMRKDEAVGNKKKMKKIQVCLPKHNKKLDNNLLTVEPRAVDRHCFGQCSGSGSTGSTCFWASRIRIH